MQFSCVKQKPVHICHREPLLASCPRPAGLLPTCSRPCRTWPLPSSCGLPLRPQVEALLAGYTSVIKRYISSDMKASRKVSGAGLLAGLLSKLHVGGLPRCLAQLPPHSPSALPGPLQVRALKVKGVVQSLLLDTLCKSLEEQEIKWRRQVGWAGPAWLGLAAGPWAGR